MTKRCFHLTLLGSLFFLHILSMGVHAQVLIWANEGGDKVIQSELRATNDAAGVINSIWDGRKITVFGARNEVVSFNLILEAPAAAATNVTVSFDHLTEPGGTIISSKATTANGVFDWTDRNIELFYIRYLEIKGLSHDLCYNALYDERHVPQRFRRAYTGAGEATGAWQDRPDHNKQYPDIAVPLELANPFGISAGKNQSIWVDIYIPKSATARLYKGAVTIGQEGVANQIIPVELTVRNFSLPDYPSAPTMLCYSSENINYRYLASSYIDPGSNDYQKSLDLVDRHFQLAHRHKISLIDGDIEIDRMSDAWVDRLNGNLFTRARGYDGPGAATGNNVYSIGTYGSWSWVWSEDSEADMWSNTDAWVNWFDAQAFTTPTEYFLYLIDESDNFPQTEQWAQWIDNNPGPGNRMLSMATISSPTDWENNTPSLDIPTSSVAMGITDLWENATQRLVQNSNKRFYYYNGARPASGSFCTEDDGIALRVNGWIQHKKKIDRWFYWESTYYDNYQAGEGQTDVFHRAQTYGENAGNDTENALGEHGWNYTNGDGVLFYPGTDRHYPQSSYGIAGPLASLRLKHWRRGIQDADYLALAANVDAAATAAIVERIIPTVLWEYGVENEEDPTYVYTDISWPTNPDDWEAARKELAHIIESAVPGEIDPIPEIKANGGDGPLVISHGENLTVTVSLACGDHCGKSADWWVVMKADTTGRYWYTLGAGWILSDAPVRVYGGPLFDIVSFEVPDTVDLPLDSYTFYFGVDTQRDGLLNIDSLFYDQVQVAIH